MSAVERVLRAPLAALEFTNILLTQNDAKVGVTPKDVVWTHRKTTLYRYRSSSRRSSSRTGSLLGLPPWSAAERNHGLTFPRS